MAERAATFAESLGVEHVTTKIPWGEGIYPPKPTSGKTELLARDARYALFFTAMRDARISTLALAHHGDDQAETMLMRLGKGTTKLGMVGMRPRIRMGMGSEIEGLNWRGHLGLQMYKIRPLLDVGKVSFFYIYIYNSFQWSVIIDLFFFFGSKDRILATCEANKLEYVNDPSNFQPDFTIRNAIRRCLDSAEEGKEPDPTFSNFPGEIANELKHINKAAAKYPELNISLGASRECLREAAKTVAKELDEVDATGLSFSSFL